MVIVLGVVAYASLHPGQALFSSPSPSLSTPAPTPALPPALSPAKAVLPAPSPGPRPPDFIEVPVEIPVLTEQQIEKATQLLSSHPLGERLAKYAYTISEIRPWVDESYGIRGAGMTLSLPSPLAPSLVLGDWPYIQPDPSAPYGYEKLTMSITPQRVSAEFATRHVQRFMVLIDFESEALVELLPLLEDA